MLNFLVLTGTMPSVRVFGTGSQSVYLDDFSEQDEGLPTQRCKASWMCLLFVVAIQCFESTGCSCIRRLGYQTNAQELLMRPILERNAATILELHLESAGTNNMFSNSILKPLVVEPSLTIPMNLKNAALLT